MQHSRCRRQAELVKDLLRGNNLLVQQHAGRQIVFAELQVIGQAGDVGAALLRAADDLRSDATLAYQQTLVDEFLERPADRWPRNAELLHQHLLVLDSSARRQLPTFDRLT